MLLESSIYPQLTYYDTFQPFFGPGERIKIYVHQLKTQKCYSTAKTPTESEHEVEATEEDKLINKKDGKGVCAGVHILNIVIQS